VTITSSSSTSPDPPYPVTVLTGTAVSREDRVTGGGSVYDGHGSITIDSIPIIWIRDDLGKEHRVESDLVSNCREGHRVAIFWEGFGKQRLIAIANLSTDQSYGRSHLTDDSTPGSILTGGFFLAIALAIPVLSLWLGIVQTVADIVGFSPDPDFSSFSWFWSSGMILVGSSALFLSWKIQAGNDSKRRALRAEINAVTQKLKASTSSG
jgi:hypothetical protein